jgi:PAS domain S-box-containing protein
LKVAGKNTPETNYNELEAINRKLRAIHRLRGIIFRKKKGSWVLADICETLTRRGAYSSAWIALTGPGGRVREFAEAGLMDLLGVRYGECADPRGPGFSKALVKFLKTGEPAAVNRDPLLPGGECEGIEAPEGTVIITLRIEYKSRVFGVLSASFRAGLFPLEDETLLLYEVANDIAFALHDMESDSMRRELESIVNSLEARHRTVFENTGNATCVFEEDTTISLANGDFEVLSGYTKEEIEGKMSWTTFIEKEDLERMREYHRMRRIDPGAAPRNYYFRFIDRFGAVKDIYMTIALIPHTKKSIASFMDITEQKRLEREILKTSEKERREIGNNLHDGLGPHLVGVKFMLNLLKQKLGHRQVPEVAAIDEIATLIDQAVSQTRMLVKGLCPVDIDSEGLVYALRDLTAGIENRFGIACPLSYDESIVIEDNTTATQLYYIAQEAINNAVKHAGAARIEVSFEKTQSSLVLAVRDNGRGIETLDNPSGMGINIMKYRARLINSLLDVMRNEGGGTSVVCVLRQNG